MVSTRQAQVILLLTASLGRADSGHVRPLSNREWARFAIWLKDHDLVPDCLLDSGWRDIVSGWEDPAVPFTRLEALLNRGAALGLALEKWQRAGLWVLTRSDVDYPERLKKRLRAKAPAALYGCGNRHLLNAGGIAVVGSRNADNEDVRLAEELGRQGAEQGRTIVSGGARGIDQCAMLSSLDSGGTAVGVLADGLLRAATSSKYRKYLRSNDLALVTPFNPEARFHVGNAMSRNKHIYCLADAGVAVCSQVDRGGTWNGAVENLEAAWVPLWVKRSASPDSGNSELVKRGARWLPSRFGLDSLLAGPAGSEFEHQLDRPTAATGGVANGGTAVTPSTSEPVDGVGRPDARAPADSCPDFYRLFLEWMDVATASKPIGADDIAASLNLNKTQATTWLKRGIGDKRIRKLVKPVRYEAVRPPGGQASLLRDEA